MAYEWEYHSEATLPGDWTSVTDASGVITQTTTAAAVDEGSKGLSMNVVPRAAGYLVKSGLSGTNGFMYMSRFKLSSDFTLTTTNAARGFIAWRLRSSTGTDRLLVKIVKNTTSGTNYNLNVFRQLPTPTLMGTTTFNLTRDTWHTLVIIGAGLSSASGSWTILVDGVQVLQNTGLDFSTTSSSVGTIYQGLQFWEADTTGATGKVYMDDGWFDSLMSLTVNPSSFTVASGATQQLSAVNQNGNAITAVALWSSNSTGNATVSASGLVTGVSAGAATITATAGTVSGASSATVTTAAPTPPISVAMYDASNTSMIFRITPAANATTTPPDSYVIRRNGSIAASPVFVAGATQDITVTVPGNTTGTSTDTWTVNSVKNGVESATAASVSATQPRYGWAGFGLGASNTRGDDFSAYTSLSQVTANSKYTSPNAMNSTSVVFESATWWNRTTRTWSNNLKMPGSLASKSLLIEEAGISAVADRATRAVIQVDPSYAQSGERILLQHTTSDATVYLIASGTAGYAVKTSGGVIGLTFANIGNGSGEFVDGSATEMILRTTGITHGVRVQVYMGVFGGAVGGADLQLIYQHDYTNASIATPVTTSNVAVDDYYDNAGTLAHRLLLWETADMGSSPASFAALPTSPTTLNRTAYSLPALGILSVDPNSYANETAFRADVAQASTLYDPVNNSAYAGTNTAPNPKLSGANVDLYRLDTTVSKPSGGKSLKQIFPDNTKVTASLDIQIPVGYINTTGVWTEQEVLFDSAHFTTVGTGPDNTGMAASYKLGPDLGFENYDGRADLQVTNGSGTAGVSAVAQYTIGNVPLDKTTQGRTVTIVNGNESGPSTGTAFYDGVWRKIVSFRGKIDSTHITDRLWVYKWVSSAWTLESTGRVDYSINTGYVLPLVNNIAIGGKNFNQNRGTQGIVLWRGKTRWALASEYNAAANVFGVPSGDISDLP